MEENPFCNSLIISKIVQFLPSESLKKLRLISKNWNVEICYHLRKELIEKRILKIPQELSLTQDNFNCNINQLFANRLCFENIPSDSPDLQMVKDFLIKYGHLIREIELPQDLDYQFEQILYSNVPLCYSLILQIYSNKEWGNEGSGGWRKLQCLTLKGNQICPEIEPYLGDYPHLKSLKVEINIKESIDWSRFQISSNFPQCCRLRSVELPVSFKDPKILQSILVKCPEISKLTVRASDLFLLVIYENSNQISDLTLIIQDSQPASLFVNSRRILPSNFTDEGITGIPLEICELIRKGEISHEDSSTYRSGKFIGVLSKLRKFKLEKKVWDVCPLTEVSLFCGFNYLKNLTHFDVPYGGDIQIFTQHFGR